MNLLARNFEDSNVIFLIWTATIYLMFSIFSRSDTAYVQSLTIYTGLLLCALISAFCDWIKERQYLKLKDEVNNQTVTVYRGAFGTTQQVLVREIVVGDIIELQQGDRVPADCIILDEMNISVDERMYASNKRRPVEEEDGMKFTSKEESAITIDKETGEASDNHISNPDPFLYTDSKVMNGAGKAIVCAVGDSTLLAKMRKPEDLKIEEQKTDLEVKLEKTAMQISKYAIAATAVSVISHLLFLMLMILFSDKSMFSNDTLLEILNICIVAVVLMIVAIPEGLPLAVSIAMALSISRLKDDEILIKNLESVQSAAMLHDLCISKTGTMTKGKLRVVRYQV
jgi:Ca2+-transporting ATPase